MQKTAPVQVSTFYLAQSTKGKYPIKWPVKTQSRKLIIRIYLFIKFILIDFYEDDGNWKAREKHKAVKNF